ncbi:hypothetical protein RhiirC2_776342 [Rhizophagus irregularis]|uniref:Uncharacterized protein n=1 Tax=Rhizophagus irregularis TaxID=588596 RepID=A0A2N1NH17_9GLOM|nr:hypothetical protein RhiirC2_776342 [Rhizophagus irregularis]
MEFVPYEKFKDVEYISKGGFREITVALKELTNSKDITSNQDYVSSREYCELLDFIINTNNSLTSYK